MFDYLPLLICGISIVFLAPKILFYFTSLQDARRFAASTTLPCVNIYSPRDNMPFWLFSPWFAPLLEALPFGWGNWIRYVKRDFSWQARGTIPQKLGSDAWFTIGPGGAHLFISDADMISQATHRWRDFPKPIEQYGALNLFGANLVTTEGGDWQRHRKITGPPFNERNSSLVFQETVRQGTALLESFTRDAGGDIPLSAPVVEDLIQWMKVITLNVISGAGFQLKMAWPIKSVERRSADLESKPDAREENPTDSGLSDMHGVLSFQQSVNLVTNNAQFLILFPPWLLRISPIKLMRDMQQASENFVTYMREMIENNRTGLESSKYQADAHSSTASDLLGSIVKAGTTNSSMRLSDEETVGNIFIFIMAGHETTASTLQTGIILLASHPEYQQVIQTEIDNIWAEKASGEELSYDDYPKMRAIMALMLETLRLYPPVVMLPKSSPQAQTLTYRNQAISIPANSSVSLDIVAVQRNPRYWGSDPHDFRPSRWLMPSPYTPSPKTASESTAHPNLLCPQKGSFLAFSGGFRACLGKKFAQVEFCTLIAILLKGHSVELVPEKEGEKWEGSRKRAIEGLDDRVTILAMRMRRRVKVRLVERGREAFPPRE